MRKITQRIVGAFTYGRSATLSNTESTGDALYLFGNKIAKWVDNELYITNAGWDTKTTCERLNGLPGVSVYHKRGDLMLNGKAWNGSWVKVDTVTGEWSEDAKDNRPKGDKENPFTAVALVASLGSIFGKDQKEANDWKARMLKAGLGDGMLPLPEDWETLTEDEKERRLDGAINAIK